MQGVHYGVFALGNRQYEHFCAVGKKVQAAMSNLGATPVVRLGTGDDDVDIDEDFDAWSADLFAALEKSKVLAAGEATTLTASGVPSYLVENVADAPVKAVDVLPDGSGTSHASAHLATITTVKELHSRGSGRSCVHVEVDIAGCSATYEAGDHVAVFVENSPGVVAAAAKALGVSLTTCVRLSLPPNNPGGLVEPPPWACHAAFRASALRRPALLPQQRSAECVSCLRGRPFGGGSAGGAGVHRRARRLPLLHLISQA